MMEVNANAADLNKIVSRDPDVHSGDLVFAGTRVPIDTLVDYLKGGESVEDYLKDFPSVERWQIEGYLELSATGLDHLRAQSESAT